MLMQTTATTAPITAPRHLHNDNINTGKRSIIVAMGPLDARHFNNNIDDHHHALSHSHSLNSTRHDLAPTYTFTHSHTSMTRVCTSMRMCVCLYVLVVPRTGTCARVTESQWYHRLTLVHCLFRSLTCSLQVLHELLGRLRELTLLPQRVAAATKDWLQTTNYASF